MIVEKYVNPITFVLLSIPHAKIVGLCAVHLRSNAN
jgi:hypothetical protein